MTFLFFFRHELLNGYMHLGSEKLEEMLFLLFSVIAMLIAVVSFLRNYSLIPILGVLCCLYLMIEIPIKSWVVFFGWMLIGLIVYLLYGKRHSVLNK